MQISYSGLEALKKFEGFRDKAYLDTGGVWTIGYGTTVVDGKPVEAGMTCSEAQAGEWLRVDCATAQTAVNQLVRVPMKQAQFDALVSFTYNVGVNAFRASTLLRKLNNRDSSASAEFDRWVYDNGKVIPGLAARRKVERSMFES
jgi:lysozyme